MKMEARKAKLAKRIADWQATKPNPNTSQTEAGFHRPGSLKK